MMREIWQRVQGTILRGVYRLGQEAGMRLAQVELLGEVRDRMEHWEPYGFTARPLDGAEALVAEIGGAADHAAVLCVADRRYRIQTLETGEVAIHDDQGQHVWIRRGYVEIEGTRIDLMQGADTPVARQGEDVSISLASEPVLIPWLSALATAWNATQPGGGPLVTPPATPAPVAIASISGNVMGGIATVLVPGAGLGP